MELLPWDALPSHFLSLPTDSPTRKQHLSRLLNLISIMDSTHPSSEEHLKAWEEARGMFEEGEGYLRPNWELEGLVDVRKMGPPPPS